MHKAYFSFAVLNVVYFDGELMWSNFRFGGTRELSAKIKYNLSSMFGLRQV